MVLVFWGFSVVVCQLVFKESYDSKNKEDQELFKKQTTEHYKGQFPNTQKNSLYVTLLLIESKDDL